MATFLQRLRQKRHSERSSEKKSAQQQAVPTPRQKGLAQTRDIPPNDPIVAYFLSSPGAVEIEKLRLDSPTLKELKAAGVKLTIPLVSQGELVGLINLGERLSEQDYSSYDRSLLNSLATQAAPALRVAQMVLEQQVQAREHERMEQELQVARLIQQTLLPKELPELPDWQLTTFYQPARAVGGDFYDFIQYEDGRLGLVVGDVTDKGVPAALVMATTRSILRSVIQETISPGKVLERTNDLLFPDIPPRMFVTCFYAILNPRNGQLHYANAGHDLPYRWHVGEVAELRATGMPLGLMPGMQYEEKETTLTEGECILLYSDGLVEAHNPERDMFGFPRLIALLSAYQGKTSPINYLQTELATFTGEGWEQEDDITLVTLRRAVAQSSNGTVTGLVKEEEQMPVDKSDAWQVLGTHVIPSEVGNERLAMSYVTEAVKPFNLPDRRMEQLKTAVAEATMNAMEHGNHYNPESPVTLQVLSSKSALAVRISDKGSANNSTEQAYEVPDIEAKLAELQSPRGWGLFLIQNMVDEMHVESDEQAHTIELILYLEGGSHAQKNA
jgi:serine phosphatase RsbU (regulator of sigma subunit)/anti-sigma regulatory factor (Ser/Thr protein kinase)